MNLAKHIFSNQILLYDSPKKPRRCEFSCKNHLFSLTPSNKTKTTLLSSVSFCPKITRGNQPLESTYPQYNHDGLYYTSAFQLGVDRKASEQNRTEQYTEHLRIMKQTYERNCKALFPKPTSKHTICSVCKLNYGDHYYAHILSEHHKEQIQHSVYNLNIIQLAHKFKHLHPSKDQELSSPFCFPNYILERMRNQQSPENQNEPVDQNGLQILNGFEIKRKRGRKSKKLIEMERYLKEQKNNIEKEKQNKNEKEELQNDDQRNFANIQLSDGNLNGVDLQKHFGQQKKDNSKEEVNITQQGQQIDQCLSSEDNNSETYEIDVVIENNNQHPQENECQNLNLQIPTEKDNLPEDHILLSSIFEEKEGNQVDNFQIVNQEKVDNVPSENCPQQKILPQTNMLDAQYLQHLRIQLQLQQFDLPITQSEWIQLQLDSIQQQLVANQEEQLELMHSQANLCKETPPIEHQQQQPKEINQSDDIQIKTKEDIKESEVQIKPWQIDGLPLKEYIKIRLREKFKKQREDSLLISIQPPQLLQESIPHKHDEAPKIPSQNEQNPSIIVINDTPTELNEFSDNRQEASKLNWKQCFDKFMIQQWQREESSDRFSNLMTSLNSESNLKRVNNNPLQLEAPSKKYILQNGKAIKTQKITIISLDSSDEQESKSLSVLDHELMTFGKQCKNPRKKSYDYESIEGDYMINNSKKDLKVNCYNLKTRSVENHSLKSS